MELYVNPQITDFRQEVNGDIKMLKIGQKKEDAYANIIGQASADLDNNKTKTIDVSTYTEPVEVLPTSGKDGMKKATITLSNIPSPGGVSKLYGWRNTGTGGTGYTITETPSVGDIFYLLESHGNNISEKEIIAVDLEVSPPKVTTSDKAYSRYTNYDVSF